MFFFRRLITYLAAGFQNCPWVTIITLYPQPSYTLIRILTCHKPCNGQAKPSKRAKVTKPAEDPKVHESEQQVPASDASEKQPKEPAHETPTKIPDLSHEHTDINPLNTKSSSPLKPPEEHGEDVMITSTSFREPGQPTILAKHSAKDEFVERRKVRFDIADYSQLSVSEVFSGYLNQVHTSHDLEIDMVKQMHQKYEV